MIIQVEEKQKVEFDTHVSHPLQSWEWGEFRKKSGLTIFRLAKTEKGHIKEAVQCTLHPIPYTPWCVGYIPKSHILSPELFTAVREKAAKEGCIFVKLEPNVMRDSPEGQAFLQNHDATIIPSLHPLFPPYTLCLDLTQTEEELLSHMHAKTRYNIRIAQKHGIIIREERSDKAFQTYVDLLFETTKRQKFFAHSRIYHALLWKTLKTSGIPHLFCATYHHGGKTYTLAAWMVFLFHNTLYYPYGASASIFRHTMASNLLMWEVIRFGKQKGATLFDMWGSLGPNPVTTDPWYGFHRFKEGYGAKNVTWVGSFDFVIHPFGYKLYTFLFAIRKKLLSLSL